MNEYVVCWIESDGYTVALTQPQEHEYAFLTFRRLTFGQPPTLASRFRYYHVDTLAAIQAADKASR